MITITQTTPQPPLQVQDSDIVTFRGWYTNSFVASDGVTPVEGGNGQTGFYYEETCSINDDGFVVIPALSVQPTTGSNPTAGFFGQLFINGSPSQMVFGVPQATAGWQIPTSPTTTTFGALALYNAAVQLLYPPNTYAPYEQVLLAIQEFAGNFLFAAVGIAGITQLSFAPDSPSVPIALSENDPRVNANLSENTVPRVGANDVLVDGLPIDDGVDWSIQTENYVQLGDYALNNGGTRFVINDTFGTFQLLAGSAAGAGYAGVIATASGVVPASVQVQATGYSYLVNTAQGVLVLGDGLNANNGTRITIDDVNELIKLHNLPTANPAVANALWSDGGTLKISSG